MHRQIYVNLATQDHGFMYAHGFQDLDGHVWELVHMSGNPAGTS
jgi:predicted lactoylglutathione lyase